MSRLTEFLLEELRRIPNGEVGHRADLAGISREQVTRWRRERLPINPTLSTLERLAMVLGLQIVFKRVDGGDVVAESSLEYRPSRRDESRQLARLRRDLSRERKRETDELRGRIEELEKLLRRRG